MPLSVLLLKCAKLSEWVYIMIGVVLWSDPVDRKAVFWCEDQGDLAYFDGSQDSHRQDCVFEAGDMVQFDLQVDRKLRKAVNATLIEEKVCTGLQEQLRTSAAETGSGQSPQKDVKVVAFEPRKDDVVVPFRKLKA